MGNIKLKKIDFEYLYKQLNKNDIDKILEYFINEFPEFQITGKCYICSGGFDFRDYIDANNKESFEDLLLIWIHPFTKLVCCYCKQAISEIKNYYNIYFQWPSEFMIKKITKDITPMSYPIKNLIQYLKIFEGYFI